MKIKTLLLSGMVLCGSSAVFSEDQTSSNQFQKIFGHSSLNAMGSYTDFDFNSTAGDNFNRFQGNSKLYSIGAGNFALYRGWTAGVNLFRVDTSVNSQVFISPGAPASSEQTIRNNTIFGHVTKQLKPSFSLDLAGAYGQNKIDSQTAIMPTGATAQLGYSSYHSVNWFTALTAIYNRSWKDLTFTANGRLLYSQINSPNYQFIYVGTTPSQAVLPLINKALFSAENIEVGYKFDSKRMPLMPFVNAGLLQVLSYTNSRPVASSTINGISPQLSMNKNGYRLGGGLGFQHKQLGIRLEEQYYNAANTYRSYQTILSLKYVV